MSRFLSLMLEPVVVLHGLINPTEGCRVQFDTEV